MKTKVVCLLCPTCEDLVYSRAHHDYRLCSCGEIAIDGGFDYTRIAYKNVRPERVIKSVNASKQELFDDWNKRVDKFGLIKKLTKKTKSVKVKSDVS